MYKISRHLCLVLPLKFTTKMIIKFYLYYYQIFTMLKDNTKTHNRHNLLLNHVSSRGSNIVVVGTSLNRNPKREK